MVVEYFFIFFQENSSLIKIGQEWGVFYMQTGIHFFVSCLVLLRMGNISDRNCRENEKTHFIFSNFFFGTHAIYGVMWNNIVEPDRPQMIIWQMHIACWITASTNTCSEHVILIFCCNIGFTNSPQCYTIHTLPVFFVFLFCFCEHKCPFVPVSAHNVHISHLCRCVFIDHVQHRTMIRLAKQPTNITLRIEHHV
jgi:hypothetical protein